MTTASGVSYAEVEEAVRSAVATKTAEGADRVAFTGPDLARLMGLHFDQPRAGGYLHGASPYQALDRQARRALDKLAGEGLLIRQGRNDREPTGRLPWNGLVTYWTPAGAAAERVKRDEAAAERAAWGDVHDQLAALGITGRDERRDGPPRLRLEDWQALVKILHGRAWPGNVPATESEGR